MPPAFKWYIRCTWAMLALQHTAEEKVNYIFMLSYVEHFRHYIYLLLHLCVHVGAPSGEMQANIRFLTLTTTVILYEYLWTFSSLVAPCLNIDFGLKYESNLQNCALRLSRRRKVKSKIFARKLPLRIVRRCWAICKWNFSCLNK